MNLRVHLRVHLFPFLTAKCGKIVNGVSINMGIKCEGFIFGLVQRPEHNKCYVMTIHDHKEDSSTWILLYLNIIIA